jgi:C-terminal processing protease CtpA/Prc
VGAALTHRAAIHTLCSTAQVVAPLPGGPAEKAGVKAGDVIAAVGGSPTKGLSLYEASDLLQVVKGGAVHACAQQLVTVCTT